MKRLLIACLLLMATAFAQSGPALHSRRNDGPGAQTYAVKGISTLPENASGEYELDGQGSVIQITIEHGRLRGYVTKMDHETALTLFFERTTIDRDRLSFRTKTVHGLRYSFQGTIVRGDAESLSRSGFYRLVGELTSYRNRGNEMERVSLKSTPRD
ncbi:MAG: hypothetical protein WAM66_12020 [Acidobacteriaceae bacterium]